MKKIFLTIVAITFLSAALAMADTYKASMTGIECSGCKKKIVKAIGAMQGVESVRIAMLKKKGQHVLTVETDGTAEITLEQAKEAVAIAEHYQLTSWEKKDK
jgi:copper chaperone CopZ